MCGASEQAGFDIPTRCRCLPEVRHETLQNVAGQSRWVRARHAASEARMRPTKRRMQHPLMPPGQQPNRRPRLHHEHGRLQRGRYDPHPYGDCQRCLDRRHCRLFVMSKYVRVWRCCSCKVQTRHKRGFFCTSYV